MNKYSEMFTKLGIRSYPVPEKEKRESDVISTQYSYAGVYHTSPMEVLTQSSFQSAIPPLNAVFPLPIICKFQH